MASARGSRLLTATQRVHPSRNFGRGDPLGGGRHCRGGAGGRDTGLNRASRQRRIGRCPNSASDPAAGSRRHGARIDWSTGRIRLAADVVVRSVSRQRRVRAEPGGPAVRPLRGAWSSTATLCGRGPLAGRGRRVCHKRVKARRSRPAAARKAQRRTEVSEPGCGRTVRSRPDRTQPGVDGYDRNWRSSSSLARIADERDESMMKARRA